MKKPMAKNTFFPSENGINSRPIHEFELKQNI